MTQKANTSRPQNILLVYPPYPHFSGEFVRDPAATIPIPLLYAGALIEGGHLIDDRNAQVSYFDSQLHDIDNESLEGYNQIGISVMGAQNLVSAFDIYKKLTKGHGIDPTKIFFGGQGVEYLAEDEFRQIFPNSRLVPRQTFGIPGYNVVSLGPQIEKLTEDDLRVYFGNEITLLFSQGCIYACTFCAADKGKSEQFYNTKANLDYILSKAKSLGFGELQFYTTALDFFQQWLPNIKNSKQDQVISRLEIIAESQRVHGVKASLRSLTRTDSFNQAMTDERLVELVKRAGFYSFGVGGEGTFTPQTLRAIRKGISPSDGRRALIEFYETCERQGFTADNLYVFGFNDLAEDKRRDADAELRNEEKSCIALLEAFPTSVIRLYISKEAVPGNIGWGQLRDTNPELHRHILQNPELIINLGYEVLANPQSHPNEEFRKMVNRTLVNVASFAHLRGQLANYHTIPIVKTDGNEILTPEDIERYRGIIQEFNPDVVRQLNLQNLPQLRKAINRSIDRDK